MRTEGRVEGGHYVLTRGDAVLRRIPLAEAQVDQRVKAAIQRNNWERIASV
jgi:hypothetical protein